jgi:hypothetical protein
MKTKIIQLIAAVLIALAVFGGVAAATAPAARDIEKVLRHPVKKLSSPIMVASLK